MKSEILSKLRDAAGYVSGQDLCQQLQVSRTAVWKYIKQLQEEGYEIEAVSKKGYRLLGWPDTIAAEEVTSRLKTEWIGHPCLYFKEINSTNTYAKKIAEENAVEGTLVIADEQTQGKGRRGRIWTTPLGTAIAMTVLLRPSLPPERVSMVTLVMGLAVAKACLELYALSEKKNPAAGAVCQPEHGGVSEIISEKKPSAMAEALQPENQKASTRPIGIKWPNDVVIHGKKICGILTEMSAELASVNYVVIGTGINANVQAFPEELKKTATSLAIELGEEVNRAELIAHTMKYFEQYYEQFLAAGDLSPLLEEYNALLLNKDSMVRVLEPGNEYNGTALGINKRGELLVRRENGTVTAVYAGEVSIRGVYGYV